ncbi:histidine kinase CKI1 [Euphorbia lathyris]|uniref:histidine kinase CKI1 n=1 Tax=Euphorbia lathyris TaxID=212925 RepID=UPI00331435F3
MNGTQLSFHEIETNVAPALFLALSITSELSQISYFGLDGLLFSYYVDEGQLLALYSNVSHSSMWYTNPVNRDTGKLYGDAVVSKPMFTVNETWLQMAMNSSISYSSIGSKWHKGSQYSLLRITAPMDGRGVISLGYPLEIVTYHFAALDFHGGYFFLSTIYGHVIMPTKAKDTIISVDDGLVKVKIGSMYPNHLVCHSFTNDSKALQGTEIGGYKFFCSTLDIDGVSLVYVLQYPLKGFAELVLRYNHKSMVLLVLVLVFTAVPNFIFMFLTLRAIKREMFLCAALIKQLEATQQAERKSMNKTKAYVGINHDVRGSLAAVTGFIDICQGNVKEGKISELETNLSQMKNCTDDLLRILNSVLNMSKLEAGRASLELEDFSLAQLLEDVVDMYYPLGMKKEVDIVLDPCDGSILKLALVRGDRLKLKQILCNLISNATKFTSDGHVSVRAVVKRTNLKKEIIASNRTPTLKMFSWFYCREKHGDGDTCSDLDAFHAVKENPNELEIEFEVDDTGRGIPRDKQFSIFEDYVQVKETAIGQEGCGLGLGIVQSLVRIMKGELRIVEKEPGERGTCFRFNIFVSTCGQEAVEMEEDRASPHFQFMSPKPEGSHMVMCIHGEERRKVLKKYIENLNIKVTIINPGRDLRSQLERLNRRLDLPHFGPLKTADSTDNPSPSLSLNSDIGSNSKNLSIRDGADLILPQYKVKSPSGIIVFVIDSNAASSCYEFDRIISRFRKETQKFTCKFVWLEDEVFLKAKQNRLFQENDHIIHKPFHGSRLIQVLSLLPEFKGTSPSNMSTSATGSTSQQEAMDYDFEKGLKMIESGTSKAQVDGIDKEMPLKGKKVLLVEDNKMLQHVTSKFLTKRGAEVEICSNGEEAVHKVLTTLDSKSVIYDYIFMDCEMPKMNGYKATKLIREVEGRHGVHIPIIALSAHAMPEEASKSIDAGMDFHLNKPLQLDQLLELTKSIDEHNQKRSKATEDRSWIVSESVDGGSIDGSMIPNFLGHAASQMLGGHHRSYLMCYNISLACSTLERWYQGTTPELRDMIDRTGLSHLSSTMFKNLDAPLISAFVERWQPDMNSFHMPFGEMAILLHYV